MSIPTTLRLSPASLALREVAGEDPGKAALEIDDQRITYGRLNEQADRLAHRLTTELGPADHRIALRVNGTHALTVGFLAIQRAGMISVGIDPTAPPERVRDILDDVEPALLLSDVQGDGETGFPVPVFDVWAFGSEADPVPTDCERGELVSIVYTSGSGGRPKGIMKGHGQTSGLILRELDAGSRLGSVLAGTVAHAEFVANTILLMRGTLVAYEIRRHGLGRLGAWLQSSELDSCYLVPTILRHVLPTITPGTKLRPVRKVFLSGETATWDDVTRLRRILDEETVIVNVFGQSETGPIASFAIPSDVPAGQGRLPAGRPNADLDVTIVGDDGQPVPTGERGEIVVRSQHATLGYWRRPELTRATYIELPDGVRQVRTGDEGRMHADGTLQHLGRLDHLVKISGNRVELGEVEAALAALSGVDGAAAAVFTDETESTRLAACVIPEPGAVLEPRVLRVALARRLPGYMVPTRIAVSDSLPRLPGGKVDRGAVASLPTLDLARSDGGAAPASGLERQLEEIWRELLPLDQIYRDDDFFALGGDSMRAARMFVEIERRLGIDRPVSLLAEAPTIASLAAVLNDSESPWSAPLAVWTEGARPPLFVIHDGAGSVLYTRGLAAALGADQPIYGVRCEALNGSAPKEQSIIEFASRYVEQMRALYEDGPYVLYGASLGGVIALEMARQLLEAGTEVPLVVLGDSFVPGPHVVSRGSEVAFHRRMMGGLSPMDRGRYLMRLAIEKLAWLVGEEGRTERREDSQLELAVDREQPIPAALRGRWVMRELRGLLVSHQVRPPFPERTLLLRTSGPGQLTDGGWRELLGASLRVANIPLTHRDLGREASGAHVGPVIRAELDRVALKARPVVAVAAQV